MHKIILYLTMSYYTVKIFNVCYSCVLKLLWWKFTEGGILCEFSFIYIALPNITSSLSVVSETMAVSSCRVMN